MKNGVNKMKKHAIRNVLLSLVLCLSILLTSCNIGSIIDSFGSIGNSNTENSNTNSGNDDTNENGTTENNENLNNGTPNGGNNVGEENKGSSDGEEESKMWVYSTDRNGVTVRDLKIKTKKGGEAVTIIQISDIHFNYCNEQDFEEANPAIMSTYEYRTWLKDGKSLNNALKCLEYAEDADQLVITGDTLDYLSYGALEMAKENIFDVYPDAFVALGDHEVERQMEGKVEDTSTLESRYELLEQYWPHDLFYSSVVLEDKVMIIQMDNSSANGFLDCQVEPFKRDMQLARENDYTVLLFFHTNLRTNNYAYRYAKSTFAGASSGTSPVNLMENGVGRSRSSASAIIYDIIVNNADVIGACFCGHMHSDYYTEIVAKNADGTDALIPQYILVGASYTKGHVLRITVE